MRVFLTEELLKTISDADKTVLEARYLMIARQNLYINSDAVIQ